MEKKSILELFESTGALQRGHFLLTSGLHSPEYFQCAKVLQFPQYNELLCDEIARHFHDWRVDVVIAPAIGGIMVEQEVARQLRVRGMFAERDGKSMMLRRGFEIKQGERTLVCEDVVTTGGSVKEVVDLVKNSGGVVVAVSSIVDRSAAKSGASSAPINFGAPFFSLLKMEVPAYQAKDCPLCRENIPVVKPGSRRIEPVVAGK